MNKKERKKTHFYQSPNFEIKLNFSKRAHCTFERNLTSHAAWPFWIYCNWTERVTTVVLLRVSTVFLFIFIYKFAIMYAYYIVRANARDHLLTPITSIALNDTNATKRTKRRKCFQTFKKKYKKENSGQLTLFRIIQSQLPIKYQRMSVHVNFTFLLNAIETNRLHYDEGEL